MREETEWKETTEGKRICWLTQAERGKSGLQERTIRRLRGRSVLETVTLYKTSPESMKSYADKVVGLLERET